MGLISVTNIADGTVIDANDVNSPINAIVNEINGNLSEANLDNSAITTDKLAAEAVTTAKITNGAVTYDKWLNTIAFRVQRLTTQAVSASTFATVQFTTIQYDIGNNFSTSTYRFTAPITGIYHFDASVGVGNNSTRVICSIYKNGSEVARGSNGYFGANSANRTSIGTDLYLEANDYVTVAGWRADAGNLEPDSGHGMWFSGHLVTKVIP